MLFQYWNKFNEINAMSEDVFDSRCAEYNNCSICPMALHVGISHNRCTYGMSAMEFQLITMYNDCDY